MAAVLTPHLHDPRLVENVVAKYLAMLLLMSGLWVSVLVTAGPALVE